MSDPHDITVRVQALGGQWEVLGADRYAGVVPEGVGFTFNDWGPDTCGFVLRRDTGAVHPDLGTWTPIEVEVAGVPVWDGRVKETPTGDGDDPQISVQCEGWQYHLDDDVYQRSYIHTKLTDFVDNRSFVSSNLVFHTTGYDLAAGDGGIVLGLPNGAVMIANTGCCATLDLGPGCSAITVVTDVATSFNTPNLSLLLMSSDVPDWTPGSSAGREDHINRPINDASFVSAGNVITITTTVTASHRYLNYLLYWPAGGTATVPVYARITGCRAFSAGVGAPVAGQSVTKADYIVRDAITQCAPLLSTDFSQIQAGTFSIPEFALDGQHTPREVLTAVNAYENYELKVLLGRRVAFRPRASAPAYEIGHWSGADFQDGSLNSDEIYNRVLVQGTGPDGAQLVVERAAAGPPWKTATEAVPANAGFEVNTAGYSAVDGTITRDTGAFNTGVASGSISTGGASTANIQTTISGLKPGRAYLFVFAIRRDASITNLHVLGNQPAGGGPGFDVTYVNADLPLGVWTVKTIPFIGVGTLGIAFSATAGAIVQILHIDDLRVQRSAATLVDRRDFTRTKILPVQSAITLTSGNRIGDLYLAAHKTTPFKGGFKAVGQGGVRRVLGGAAVHPAYLQTGQLVRCSHRIDPDTGAWGREGTLANVAYDHDSLTATAALDENRAGFETLLSRLAVVTGQRST